LYPNATVTAAAQIAKHGGKDIFVYKFGLFDAFLNYNICCCRVFRSEIVQKFPREDVLRDDVVADQRMEKAGFEMIGLAKKGVIIGTHFDDPDEFQIFRRFFVVGVKEKKYRKGQRVLNVLKSLKDKTGDDRYRLAIDGYMQGCGGAYPMSHNIDYDLEQYAKAGYGKGRPKCFE